jgi:hypothetical protein
VTPPLGARAPAYDGKHYTSTLGFGLVARLAAKQKRTQTASGPPQSPIRSLEISGSQTDLLTPWYKGRAEIIPRERPARKLARSLEKPPTSGGRALLAENENKQANGKETRTPMLAIALALLARR